jgi:hypothetical protein
MTFPLLHQTNPDREADLPFLLNSCLQGRHRAGPGAMHAQWRRERVPCSYLRGPRPLLKLWRWYAEAQRQQRG